MKKLLYAIDRGYRRHRTGCKGVKRPWSTIGLPYAELGDTFSGSQ